jgi:hypothetical protein
MSRMCADGFHNFRWLVVENNKIKFVCLILKTNSYRKAASDPKIAFRKPSILNEPSCNLSCIPLEDNSSHLYFFDRTDENTV